LLSEVYEKNIISEATGSGSSGYFKVPIVLVPQQLEENQFGMNVKEN